MHNKKNAERQDQRDARRAQREEAFEHKRQFLSDLKASDEHLQRASDALDDAYADWDCEMEDCADDYNPDEYDYYESIGD